MSDLRQFLELVDGVYRNFCDQLPHADSAPFHAPALCRGLSKPPSAPGCTHSRKGRFNPKLNVVPARTSRDIYRCAAAGTLILLGAIWVAWLGFRPQVMGDYPRLFAPSMNALLTGHVGVFFANSPTDGAGGSVLLRAPFALIGKDLVGSQHAIFRFGALGFVLLSLGPALWLAREMRLAGRSALARGVLIAVFLLTPAVLGAILYGHPEEPLGASLCIAAVLLAASGRCG